MANWPRWQHPQEHWLCLMRLCERVHADHDSLLEGGLFQSFKSQASTDLAQDLK